MLQGQGIALPVLSLLTTSVSSVTEIVLLCISGYILAIVGIADKFTQQKINAINVALLTPALLFGEIAYSLNLELLIQLWTIPAGFVLLTLISWAVAFTAAHVCRLSQSQKAFVLCASMFQNTNSLLIALVSAIVTQLPELGWHDEDTIPEKLSRGITYLALYTTFGMSLKWSLGLYLLRTSAEAEVSSNLSFPNHVDSSFHPSLVADGDYEANQISALASSGSRGLIAPTIVLEGTSAMVSLHTSHFQNVRYPRLAAMWKFFIGNMKPPTWASLASIIVALVPPLQGSLAEVIPVRHALTYAAECSIPMTLLMLGASFAPDQQAIALSMTVSNDEAPLNRTVTFFRNTVFRRSQIYPNSTPAKPKENLTVFVALVSRMVLTPLLCLPPFALAVRMQLFDIFMDPIFVLVAVLLISAPPALTLVQIMQVVSDDTFESLISKTITWSYAAMTPPLTLLYVFLGLAI